MKIELGHTVRDRITGFEGVVTGLVAYISGCNQALVSPKVGNDGGLKDNHWFDLQRLDLQPAEPVVLDNGATPGCDRPAPRR